MSQTFMFQQNMFVWLDESGADRRDSLRKFGYALRGTTPVSHRFLCRGQRVNAIAAITAEGVLATEITKGSLNGEKFFDFLRGTLIPKIRAFDGSSSHSVLVLDNCSVHHIPDVTELLSNAVVLFLPPYSPDLNPHSVLLNNTLGNMMSCCNHCQTLQMYCKLVLMQ